jgi:hypothetical protein
VEVRHLRFFGRKQLGRLIYAVSLGFLFSLVVISSSLALPVSAHIPFDSWIYPALEKVCSLCWVETSLTGIRPITRTEAARQLAEALQNADRYEVPVAAAELLQRLKSELKDELKEIGPAASPVRENFLSVHDLSLRYVYKDGPDSFFPGTSARQFALNYNNDGIEYAAGQNAEASILAYARFFQHFLLDWRPSGRLDDEGSFETQTLQGGITAGWGPVALQIGKQPLWWGQGRHGSLILTDNAEPLTMVRLTNPSPGKLPWILQYLGPIRFDFFVSRLEKDRIVSEPYLAGIRVDFRPCLYFEMGASRTVMFGGEGRPELGFDDFLTIIGGENLGPREDTSNSLAAIDARLTLPMLWNLQIYGDYGGEDDAGALFSKQAFLVGVYFPQLERTGRLSGRIEYADTNTLTDSPVWYRHGVYQSGYTYRKKILGHHAGGDARDLYFGLEGQLSPDLILRVELDIEKRNLSGPIEERHLQPGIEIAWYVTERLLLKTRYAFDRATHVGEDRDDETLHFLVLRADYKL